jgi:hypothetical protein
MECKNCKDVLPPLNEIDKIFRCSCSIIEDNLKCFPFGQEAYVWMTRFFLANSFEWSAQREIWKCILSKKRTDKEDI